jgi:hypothetical protein
VVAHDDGRLIEDPEGSPHDDVQAAFEEAAQAARTILGDAVKAGREPAGCAVVIVDQQGRQLGTVRFVDVLPETIIADLAHP